jgi:hypothetical protein
VDADDPGDDFGKSRTRNGRRFKSFKPIKPKRAVSLAGIVLEDRR